MAKNKTKTDKDANANKAKKGLNVYGQVYINIGGISGKAFLIDNSDGLITGSADDDDDIFIMTSPFNRKTKKQ